MATDRANDLQAFRDFIDQAIISGVELTLEEALARWDDENLSESDRETTRAAIRAGLSDLDAGRIRPFEEFDREFRARRELPPLA